MGLHGESGPGLLHQPRAGTSQPQDSSQAEEECTFRFKCGQRGGASRLRVSQAHRSPQDACSHTVGGLGASFRPARPPPSGFEEALAGEGRAG